MNFEYSNEYNERWEDQFETKKKERNTDGISIIVLVIVMDWRGSFSQWDAMIRGFAMRTEG